VKKTSSAASSDESFNVGGINVKMSLRERFKTKRKAEMSLASGMFVSARIISKGTVVLRLILDLRFFFSLKSMRRYSRETFLFPVSENPVFDNPFQLKQKK